MKIHLSETEFLKAELKRLQDDMQALAAQQEHEPENEPFVSLASVQEPVPVFELQKSGWEIICDLDWIQTLPFGTKLYTTPPAQPAPVQHVAWGKPTDEMVQAATDEYDEWAVDNKGTTECIRAMLVKALKATPPAQPAVPDALTSADIQEHIEYVAGWNDCRQAMLEMMK
jgi:hypothetical protein